MLLLRWQGVCIPARISMYIGNSSQAYMTQDTSAGAQNNVNLVLQQWKRCT